MMSLKDRFLRWWRGKGGESTEETTITDEASGLMMTIMDKIADLILKDALNYAVERGSYEITVEDIKRVLDAGLDLKIGVSQEES